MRVLITSLSTYSAPYNDGKLKQLGPRLEALTVVSGDVKTLWGRDNPTRSGSGYEVIVLPLRCARTNATARFVGLDEVADLAQPTLVHVECEPWQQTAVQSVKLAQRLAVPVGVLFAECGPRLRGPGGWIRRARASRTLKHCNYAVGWSTASTRVAERLSPGIQTETIPATGVCLTETTTNSSDEWFGTGSAAIPKVAFLGRFSEEKGIGDFLEICDELARYGPVRTALAGGEGTEQMVTQWANERPWAFMHGIIPRTRVSSLLSAADALVCPSRTTRLAEEQFGKAAVEAMAVGTPVFAYSCGALLEVIGRGGVVVSEGARDQLVMKLRQYFAEATDHSRALAQEARKQAANFTDDALADRLLDLWTRVSN